MQTVVYCPGLDGNAHEIEGVAKLLDGIKIVPVEYPERVDETFEEIATLVVAMLRQHKTGLLAGNSFGGAVAVMTTLLHPTAVKSLCLIATFNHEPEPFAAGLGRLAGRYLPKALLRPVSRWLADWKLAGKLEGENRRKFLDSISRMNTRIMAARLGLLRGYDVRPLLRKIRIPVQVICAAKDSISGTHDQIEPWRHMLHSEVDIVADTGHVIPHEQPERLAELMRAWIARAA